MLKSMLIVGLGSFAGGAARYLISCAMKTTSGGFPWATLSVNLAGCLLIGLVYSLFSRHGASASHWCLLLTTGLCGGFTTFSTFANEALAMLHGHNLAAFAGYVAASLVGGLLLAAAGYSAAKLIPA